MRPDSAQILAYSGATHGLLQAVLGLAVAPIVVILSMQFIVLVMGTFMEQVAIMLITLPLYIPIVKSLGYDPIWFAILMLINLQMALTTPPFGFLLFVIKGVAPVGTTMRQIYLAAFPFLLCDAVAMTVILVYPDTVNVLIDLVYSK